MKVCSLSEGVLNIIVGLWHKNICKNKNSVEKSQTKLTSHQYDGSNSLHYKAGPFRGWPLDGPGVQAASLKHLRLRFDL